LSSAVHRAELAADQARVAHLADADPALRARSGEVDHAIGQRQFDAKAGMGGAQVGHCVGQETRAVARRADHAQRAFGPALAARQPARQARPAIGQLVRLGQQRAAFVGEREARGGAYRELATQHAFELQQPAAHRRLRGAEQTGRLAERAGVADAQESVEQVQSVVRGLHAQHV
jgi:hypothetical protein